MRKIGFLTILTAVLSLISFQAVQADLSERIEVGEVIGKRSITITHPDTGDDYLLYLYSGCGYLEEGQRVSLVTKGDLDGRYDLIKVDSYHRCSIATAWRYTDTYEVYYVYPGNDEAEVIDKNGNHLGFYYGPACSPIRGYKESNIYMLQGGSSFKKGDKIYFPDNAGQCSAGLVKEIDSEKPTAVEETDEDIKVPTTVKDVKASPGNGEVFLSWDAASDNEEISHYIISFNRYKIDPRNVPVSEMPNQAETTKTNLTISDLENNKLYYFYVLAVDTSGNTSSDWSEVATTTPRSSIPLKPSAEDREFDLRLGNETSRSFTFYWNILPGTRRQTVILKLDGAWELSSKDPSLNSFRVLKRSHRKGRKLSLTVRAYDFRTLIKEEEIEFEF